MSVRQPDLFYGDRQPPRTVKPARAYRREERGKAKAFAWESMGAWVRHMHRLFAIESPSSDHYARTRETARGLTIERIRECRHDDDLARCEAMLVEARSGWLYGLDRAFTRAERGALLVEDATGATCSQSVGSLRGKKGRGLTLPCYPATPSNG